MTDKARERALRIMMVIRHGGALDVDLSDNDTGLITEEVAAALEAYAAEAVAADRASGCPCRCHWTTAQQMAINYCPRYTIAQQQERARGGEKP